MMMDNIKFKGIYSPIYSLYDKNMNVLKDSVEKLVRFNLKNGIKGFYVGGNTGECPVLPNQTRKQMLEAVKSVSGDFSIIAHIGAGHFDDTLDLLDHANSIGVDAVSSLPPSLGEYYASDEILEYYRILAKKSKSPVLAYVTSALNCDVLWFVKELMKIENVIGVKLTVHDYYLFNQVKTVNGGNINVLNGPDQSLLAGLAMGADGAIGTTYNFMPKTACAIYDCFQKGDMKKALEEQTKLNQVINILLPMNIAFWKLPLIGLGIDVGYTVAPQKMPTKEETKEVLDKLMKTAYAENIS